MGTWQWFATFTTITSTETSANHFAMLMEDLFDGVRCKLTGYAIVKVILTMLERMSPESNLQMPDRNEALCRVQEAVEWLHSHGLDRCLSRTLEMVAERGYPPETWHFLEEKDDAFYAKHVEIAIQYHRIQLMRWLIEQNGQVHLAIALNLVKKGKRVEVMRWLSETDRVSIVCPALSGEWPKQKEVLTWILENTSFEWSSSRHAIRNALQRAPNNMAQWLVENLHEGVTCNWYFDNPLQ